MMATLLNLTIHRKAVNTRTSSKHKSPSTKSPQNDPHQHPAANSSKVCVRIARRHLVAIKAAQRSSNATCRLHASSKSVAMRTGQDML